MAKKDEVTHESLMDAISVAEKALKEAKEEYKAFCKANPFKLPEQPSLHALRKLREKNDKKSDADHAKSNKAAQASAQKAQLIQEVKGV